MSKVATYAPDPDDRPTAIVHTSDVQKSDSQIGQLLHILARCETVLVVPDSFEQRVAVDSIAIEEARKTYALTHTRLRDLVDETGRWGLQRTHNEREAAKIITASARLYRAKTKNATIHNRPSIFLRSKIGIFDAGWICWVGGENPTPRDLHAIGRTPEEACLNFDRVWNTARALADKVEIPAPVVETAPVPSRRNRKTKNDS